MLLNGYYTKVIFLPDILVQHLTEQDTLSSREQTAGQVEDAYERLFSLADKNGIGQSFRVLYDACVAHDLYPRLYKWSIMYTPPDNKNRMLIAAWVKPKYKKLELTVNPEAFAGFYPVDEQRATESLAPERHAYYWIILKHSNL